MVKPEDVFKVLERMGGENGWWGLELIWRFRGLIDRVFGGEGFVCHRSQRYNVAVGDQIDFLDVKNIVQSKELLLKVRFKLPGVGWIRFQTNSKDSQRTILVLTVFFAPKGLLGLSYWYCLLPFHRLVFNIMLKKITIEANRLSNQN